MFKPHNTPGSKISVNGVEATIVEVLPPAHPGEVEVLMVKFENHIDLIRLSIEKICIGEDEIK